MNKLICFVLLFLTAPALFAQEAEKKFELTEIKFLGNENIPSSELIGIITSKETPNWAFKLLHKITRGSLGSEPVYFDSLKIQEDLAALNNYYNDNGYFESRIKGVYELNDEDEEAKLIFHIIEGEKFRFSNFTIDGLNYVAPRFRQEITDLITIDTTKTFSVSLVDGNRVPVLNFLQNNGYMLAEMREPVIVNVDTFSNTVSTRLRLIPGRRYKIGDIRIERKGPGKDFVEDTLIKKIVDIESGDTYNLEKLNRSQVRLYRTNMFSSVLVNTVISDTNGNFVPLNISADVTSMHELTPELIINNQESAFNVGLGGNYTQKNFLGGARTLTVTGSFAIQDVFNVDYSKLPKFLALGDTSILGYFDGRVAVQQPFLFNKPITTRLEGYSTINKQREYKNTAIGAKLSFDFELPKFVYFNALTTYYTVERSKYAYHSDYIKKIIPRDIPPSRRDSLVARIGSASSTDFTSIIGVDVSANKTNDILFPTRGYSILLTAEEANLIPSLLNKVGTDFLAKSQFYRLLATFTYFPGIYRSQTDAFGFKLRAGYVQTYSGSPNDIPLNKRFTAGGSNSVRGWRSRELVPQQSFDITNLSIEEIRNFFVNNLAIGGTFLLEGSVETRNRIAGPIGGAVFIDYGNTWNGYKRFNISDVAVATGFGLRYYSPFGPIRIDVGFKAFDPVGDGRLFGYYRHSGFFSNFFKNVEFHLGLGEAF